MNAEASESKSRQALRQSFPLILTTFVNRVGTIGLSLLPILLVQRKLGSGTASFVMGGVKSVVVFGTLLAGISVDRYGARFSLLLGFVCITLGFAGLPLQTAALGILFFAVLVQMGDALTRVSNRMVLTSTVSRNLHKEAFAWLRVTNNCGQIFSFGLGAVATSLGVLPLMWLDGATSLVAFFVGRKALPLMGGKKKKSVIPEAGEDEIEKLGLRGKLDLHWSRTRIFLPKLVPAIACAGVITTWNFYYELFMGGMAARLEMIRPGQGLHFFSGGMVVNTVLCTLFAVQMAKWVKRPSRVFIWGLLVTVVGAVFGVMHTTNSLWVVGSMLMVTVGEITLGSLAQLAQIRLLPEGGAEGFFYSTMVVLGQVGRIVGAALAFPWIVSAPLAGWRPLPLFWIPLVLVLFTIYRFRREFDLAVAD